MLSKVLTLSLLATLVTVNSTPTPLEFRLFGGKRDESFRQELQTEPTLTTRPETSTGVRVSKLAPSEPRVHASKPALSEPRKAQHTCRVSFRLKNDCTQPGDTLLALGNVPALGNWHDGTALVFTTTASTFPWWHAETSVPPGTALEFKFVMKKASGELAWEQGQNRRLDVVRAEGMTMETSFGDMRANVDVQGKEERKEQRSQAVPVANTRETANSASKEVVPAQAGELVEGGKDMTARLYFRVRCETKMGEAVGVCGSVENLGAWSPAKALALKTTADEYPFWSGSADVALSQVKQVLKYKYLIKHPQGQWWEDGIADRTVESEAGKKGGALSPGLDTYVDDGNFNVLQRVCTYVREREVGNDKPRLQVQAIEEGKPFEVPEGYQLVTLDQVLQWTAQLEELEHECEQWRDRIEAAESTIVVLTAEIERGQQRKLAFVESMDTCEDHMKRLEETVEVVEEKKKKLRKTAAAT